MFGWGLPLRLAVDCSGLLGCLLFRPVCINCGLDAAGIAYGVNDDNVIEGEYDKEPVDGE